MIKLNRKRRKKKSSRSLQRSQRVSTGTSSQYTKKTSKNTVKRSSNAKGTKLKRLKRKAKPVRKRKEPHPDNQFVRAKLSNEYSNHINSYKHCEQCNLCEHTYNSVFFKGSWEVTDNRRVRPDVLFIGEAPGLVENVLGLPFSGPAGKVLDRIITESNRLLKGKRSRIRYLETNIVSCIPFKQHEDIAQPKKEHAEACEPRLAELIKLSSPKNIVLLGKVAKKYFKPNHHELDDECQIIEMTHPAFILRMDQARYEIEFTRCVLKLVKLVYPDWESNV